MTLEQIANWKSQQNPLEKVYGKESIGGRYKCKHNFSL